jgi:FKBP-type peptidyl-prolyl cis-trans isomerase SlpA
MVETLHSARIAPGSHVTFHYRIAAVVEGTEREVVSTFGARPATLTIGRGQFAAPLEACLMGLEEGACERFDLESVAGFGQRRPELVQSVSRATFDANADDTVEYVAGDIVQFSSPEGRQFSGVLKKSDGDGVVVDFNHPLAGLPIRFAVHIVGVL